MKYYLSNDIVPRFLENKYLYDIKRDELYEVDEEAFSFFKKCTTTEGCEIDNLSAEFRDFCIKESILTTQPYVREIGILTQSPIPSIRYLELQITDKCNLKCKHCYIGKPSNHELPLILIEKVLDDFQQMQGLRVMITGGEPLLHSEFEAINELLKKYALRKVLFTNGLLLNKKILKKLNVDEIQFSIDGMKYGHEVLRGKGTFERVISKLKLAKEVGFTVSVATVIHRENLHEFEEMDTYFRKIGVKDWTVDVPIPIGNLRDNHPLLVPPSIAGKYLNYGFGESYHYTSEGFACGLHLISVLANGSIAKCSFYGNNPLGHISEGLRKAVENSKPIRLEELECAEISCPEIKSCKGGCRFRATFFSDKNSKSYKKDIYKCYAYGIIK